MGLAKNRVITDGTGTRPDQLTEAWSLSQRQNLDLCPFLWFIYPEEPPLEAMLGASLE